MQRAKGTSFTSELQYIDIEFCIWHIYNIFSTFSQIVFLFFLRIMHTSLVISSSCLQKEIESQRNFAKSREIYKFILVSIHYNMFRIHKRTILWMKILFRSTKTKKINLFIIFYKKERTSNPHHYALISLKKNNLTNLMVQFLNSIGPNVTEKLYGRPNI